MTTAPTHELLEQLAELDPETATPAELATWHRTAVKLVDDTLGATIAAMRARRVSWADVGEAFGISRQAAWERFRRFNQLGTVTPDDTNEHGR